MKTSFDLVSRLCAAVVLSFALFALPSARAQSVSSSPASQPQLPAAYDLSKEVRVQGTIQQIDTANTRTPLGTHILVQTASGVVDAHLGPLNKASFDALHLSVGEAVTLTGMDESLASGSVFLVRLLTTSTRIVILRNEHGYPVRSLLPRGSASSSATMKGGF